MKLLCALQLIKGVCIVHRIMYKCQEYEQYIVMINICACVYVYQA